MIRQGTGRIINIASVVGVAAMRLQSAFVAAKAGVIHLTRSMALELGPKGILVNALAPGSAMTEVTRKLFYGADGTFHEQASAFMAAHAARPAGDAARDRRGHSLPVAPEKLLHDGHLPDGRRRLDRRLHDVRPSLASGRPLLRCGGDSEAP